MGKLIVLLEGCRDLPSGLLTGAPSPYAEVCCEGKVYKTGVERSTTAPRWNRTFHFYLADPGHAELLVRVLDHKMLGADEMLGTYSMSLRGLRRGVVLVRSCNLAQSSKAASLEMRLLAVDFGTPVTSQEAWMVTSSISDDPVQRAVERGKFTRTDYVAVASAMDSSLSAMAPEPPNSLTSPSNSRLEEKRKTRPILPFTLPPPRSASPATKSVSPTAERHQSPTSLGGSGALPHPNRAGDDDCCCCRRPRIDGEMPRPLYEFDMPPAVQPTPAPAVMSNGDASAGAVMGIPLVDVPTLPYITPSPDAPHRPGYITTTAPDMSDDEEVLYPPAPHNIQHPSGPLDPQFRY